MPALSPLKTTTRALLVAVGDLDTAAGDANHPNFKAALELTAKLWGQVQDQAKGSTTSTIADFFNAVGSGIIDAQKKLDVASEQYVRGTLQMDAETTSPTAVPPALGSMFRIPRVTAELKCSLETTHEKKFNVILYSERSDVRDFHQQTVQLEVVAVPVPPDYLNHLAAHRDAPTSGSEPDLEPADETETVEPVIFSSPADDNFENSESQSVVSAEWLQKYLVTTSEREEVRALIEKLAANQDKKARRAVIKRLLPAWSQAIVLTDGYNARFILLAAKSKSSYLFVWQLVLRPAAFQLLGKIPVTREEGPDLTRIHSLIAQLGAAQTTARSLR